MTKMISIQIQEATHRRLKSNTESLEYSYDPVINRALDQLERVPPPSRLEPDNEDIIVDPYNLPNLAHTEILSAIVTGNQMPRSYLNWSSIRNQLMRIAIQKYRKDIDWLRSKSSTKIIESDMQHHNNYQHIPKLDILVARTNTKKTSQALVNIALALSIPVKMEVTWTEKASPKFRYKRAMLRISEDTAS